MTTINTITTVTDPECFHLCFSLLAPNNISFVLCLECCLGGYVPAPLTPQQGDKHIHQHLTCFPCTHKTALQIILQVLSRKCCCLAEDGTMADYLDEGWSVGCYSTVCACRCRWRSTTRMLNVLDNLHSPEHLRLLLLGLFQGKLVWYLR